MNWRLARKKKEDSRLSHRTLYAFIFFIAGLLFEAARLSESKKNTPHGSGISTLPSPSSNSHEEDEFQVSQQKLTADSTPSSDNTGISLMKLEHIPQVEDEKTKKVIFSEGQEKTPLSSRFPP